MAVTINFTHPTISPWELLIVISGYDGDLPHVVQHNWGRRFDPQSFCGSSPSPEYALVDGKAVPPPVGYDPDETMFDYFVGHGVGTRRNGAGSEGEFFPAWIGRTAFDAVIRGIDAGCTVSMEVAGELFEGIALFELLQWHRGVVQGFQDSEEGNWNDIATDDGRRLYRRHIDAGGEVPPVFGERFWENDPKRLTRIARELLSE